MDPHNNSRVYLRLSIRIRQKENDVNTIFTFNSIKSLHAINNCIFLKLIKGKKTKL